MIDIPRRTGTCCRCSRRRRLGEHQPGREQALQRAGYIIGRLQRVIFYEPGVKETNWSATRPIVDTAGKTRRWVYLHYFKAGQPSINWLDPTFAGMRLVVGDALHSLLDLGTGALRLDANGFLGVEKSAEEQPGWSEGHPLSEAANQLIGSMIRKVGGFSFQELNLTIDDIKATSEAGPGSFLRLRDQAGVPLRAGDCRYGIPAPDVAARHGNRRRPGVIGPRPPEPRRTDL